MEELDQVVDDSESAEAEPVATTSQEPESEPTQEFDYDPPFLSEDDTPQRQQQQQQYHEQQYHEQQWSPQQVQAYNQYVRQMQQQPQQPGPSTLDRFIQNPDGTISEIAGYAAQQVAQNLMAQSYGPMAAQMREFVQGQAKYHTAVADDKIRNMYKERFAKDERFVGSKRVQERVDSAIDGLRAQAIAMAQRGDPSGFQIFNNPTFAEATLAVAKIIEGSRPSSKGSAPVPHVERTASATKREAKEISPDVEDVISRYGSAFREKYLKSLEQETEYEDFEA